MNSKSNSIMVFEVFLFDSVASYGFKFNKMVEFLSKTSFKKLFIWILRLLKPDRAELHTYVDSCGKLRNLFTILLYYNDFLITLVMPILLAPYLRVHSSYTYLTFFGDLGFNTFLRYTKF